MKTVLFTLLTCSLFLNTAFAAPHGPHADVVAAAKAELKAAGTDLSGPCGAYAIVELTAKKLVAQGEQAGVLDKPAGNNCRGRATDIIAYPEGQIYDVLVDGGGTNGPVWNDDGIVDASRYRAVTATPGLPPGPTPVPVPPAVDLNPILQRLTADEAVLASLKGEVAAQRAALDNFAANLASEQDQINTLAARPIPTSCSVPFLGCHLR